MSTRTKEKIVDAKTVLMGKFQIAQPLPVKGLTQVDPFLLLHHAGPKYHKPGTQGLNVEAHPHTGFQPVTFVFSGEVEHRDSLGNKSIIKSGGVQWINAGKGIVHSEKASTEFMRNGGNFEIIQLWINLPRKIKKSDPAYFGYEEKDIPFHLSDDNKTRLNIIAGKYKHIKGPVNINPEITAYTGMMEKDGLADFIFDQSHNALIYLLNGHISVNNHEMTDKQLIVFKQDGSKIIVKAYANSKLLILAGVPIKEPIYHYGPFVLNSKNEVIEAINDFESGKMGYLD